MILMWITFINWHQNWLQIYFLNLTTYNHVSGYANYRRMSTEGYIYSVIREIALLSAAWPPVFAVYVCYPFTLTLCIIRLMIVICTFPHNAVWYLLLMHMDEWNIYVTWWLQVNGLWSYYNDSWEYISVLM